MMTIGEMSNQAHLQKQLKPVVYGYQVYHYENQHLNVQSGVSGLTLIEKTGEW